MTTLGVIYGNKQTKSLVLNIPRRKKSYGRKNGQEYHFFIEKCLVAIEDCWKEKENMQQKKIDALLSIIEALRREISML